jgi:ABC-type transporter Mla MlaB component
MFVRNPTKDWSELDQPVDSDAAGYDKQALKAMIERKRQNDFVRKREFDQLRKLRNRDPGAASNMARPSFFQTSLPTDVGGRAGTIKKIDEIEAQMSRQWWKGKSAGASQPSAATLPGHSTQITRDTQDSLSDDEDESSSISFANTVPLDMNRQQSAGDPGDEFQPTRMASDMAAAPGTTNMLAGFEPRSEAAGAGFSTSRLFAIEVDEMATDPELEEAAIRFANSDDAGAESGLLLALRSHDLALHAAQSWVAALLDLYRATRQQSAFEAVAREFALHLDGARPLWVALRTGLPAAPPASGAAPASRVWTCPPTLTAQGMESLRQAMMSTPMPWYLGWAELQTIAPDALPLLEGLFGSLCEEEVSLRFDGEAGLTQALRALTPSGDRSVNPACWETRLNALRVMRLQDDFELTALDYCVTFGVSPPAWVEARCHMVTSGAAMAPGSLAGATANGLADDTVALVLQGEILGDANQALSQLDARSAQHKRMWIDCQDLIRVDFAAAGSILNWVAMRQAEGKQVQFQNVHRLVAAFFNVIGINEHAKVIPRPI